MEKKNNIEILSIKKQYEKMDEWLQCRLTDILPELMAKNNIDMWVILAREYNEDPIFKTLVPALEITSSRLSCLVFYIDGNKDFQRVSLCRPNPAIEKYYKSGWDGKSETQWDCLKRFVSEKKPNKIGVNVSENFALADGLSKSLHEEFMKTIGEENSKLVMSAEKLCVEWLEKRCWGELQDYEKIYKVAEKVIGEAFSKNVIKVGVTSTEDVEWWIMEKINGLGLKCWFAPTIDLQRMGEQNKRIGNELILQGDIVHCDVGLEYMGLCTDTQRLAYVLKDGESKAPEGLRKSMKNCNEFQDIVAGHFIEGRTGNEILALSLKEANDVGISAMCYTHPIGFYGHGAGPIIGLWDNQIFVPGKGDYQLNDDSCYALELNASTAVAEWEHQEVTIYLEETVAFTRGEVRYMGQRQVDFILI